MNYPFNICLTYCQFYENTMGHVLDLTWDTLGFDERLWADAVQHLKVCYWPGVGGGFNIWYLIFHSGKHCQLTWNVSTCCLRVFVVKYQQILHQSNPSWCSTALLWGYIHSKDCKNPQLWRHTLLWICGYDTDWLLPTLRHIQKQKNNTERKRKLFQSG